LTDNSDYQRRAATILRLMTSTVQRYPAGFGRLLCAFDFYLGAPKEIALIGEPGTSETKSLLAEIWTPYLPNKVVAQARPGDAKSAALIPLVRDRSQLENKPTVYVCEHFTCKKPVTSPTELASQLKGASAGTASP
jgi:uncharacterized protein YyaL (SSP411 family)